MKNIRWDLIGTAFVGILGTVIEVLMAKRQDDDMRNMIEEEVSKRLSIEQGEET